jgi:hypothetical protein
MYLKHISNVSQHTIEIHMDTCILSVSSIYLSCILHVSSCIPPPFQDTCIPNVSTCFPNVSHTFLACTLPHIMAWHTFSLETLRYVNASRTRPLDTCIQVYPGGFQWIRVYPSVSHVHCLGTCILMYLDVS